MAEFNLIQSARDALDLAAHLFEHFSAELVVDHSSDPEPARICNVGQLSEFLLATPYPPLLFVLSPAWQRYPLPTRELRTQDGRHFWYVEQRYGGPAFTWMLSRVSTAAKRQFFTVGLFGDYPWYYVEPGSTEVFKRPEPMAQAFRTVRAHVRSTGQRARNRAGRPGPWVGADALRWASAGVALGPDSEWLVERAA
jgi:hypothetical protein